MRRFINIVESFVGTPDPDFGRKGVAPVAREPADPKVRAAVAHARQYSNAEEYARDLNPISLTGGDPPHLAQRHQLEHHRLVDRWLRWQEQGYILPETETAM